MTNEEPRTKRKYKKNRTSRTSPARNMPSKTELYTQYVVLKKSAGTIAKLYNISNSTALKIIREHGIPRRKKGNAREGRGCRIISNFVCGQISHTYWLRLKFNAKVRGHEFNISPEYIWKLFEEQGGKCAVMGMPIKFAFTACASTLTGQDASLP